MNIYLLFLFIISLMGIEVFIKKFNPLYLSIKTTSCVKGLFILIVFFSHISSYVSFSSNHDLLMNVLSRFLGQLMVTSFLFYSGYGIYQSIENRGATYINNMPKRRLGKTYFHFFIAVLSYLVLSVIIDNRYSLKRISLAFMGLSSLGNSNWYIFVIMVLYLITYIAFKISSGRKAIFMTWVFSIMICFLLKNHFPNYWYNTLLCFNLGMTYSYYREKIEKILFVNKTYIMTLSLLSELFLIVRKLAHTNDCFYEIMAMLFVLIIVMITMKINFRSSILKWFGDRLFLIYMFQRMPMIILKRLDFLPYQYFVLCFISTIIITIIYDHLFKFIDSHLFKEKRC